LCRIHEAQTPALPIFNLQISTDIPRKEAPAIRSFEKHGGALPKTCRAKKWRFAMDNRITVLYVDDNPKSSRLLTSVLEECGFRVITRNDPIEALALCRRTYFDLALLDYEMPSMTGARLAREIKHLMPEIPVVLISGRLTLPPEELEFVDSHFGFGTSLDDLLWTMRILVPPQVVVSAHEHSEFHLPIPHQSHSRQDREDGNETAMRWADST
jgi:CheY-like chemotaxis protein